MGIEWQNQTIKTQVDVEQADDILIDQIQFNVAGYLTDIMQFWYSAEFKQVYMIFNYELSSSVTFGISYNGVQCTKISSSQEMWVPTNGIQNPQIAKDKKIFFYPTGPTDTGVQTFAKIHSVDYMVLNDCSIFPWDGGEHSAAISFVFDMHVKHLQNNYATGPAYTTILASVDALSVTS